MIKFLKTPQKFINDVLHNLLREDLFTQSAAAGYYAVFSMPGLILIASAIASLIFDRALVQDQINSLLQNFIGQKLSFDIQDSLSNMNIMGKQWIAFLIGFGVIFYGASRFFMQLQKSLNTIWGVTPKKSSILMTVLKKRLTSLVLVLCSGLIIMLLLTMTSILTFLADYIAVQLPLFDINLMLVVNWMVSYIIIVLLFTLLYKIIPDAIILWRSSLYGAALSAALFMIGQGCINYYFSVTNPQSVFGAAGSIILLMLWVSYAFMILMLGAAFTKTHMEWVTGYKAKADKDVAKKLSTTK